MSILNIFRNQLSKVIEWENPHPALLWWQYPNVNDEIKNSSKLIISPGFGAVLVYEGKVADVLSEPGLYALETDNHPFITTLMNLRQNFESEHKLKIFFFKTTEILNQDWGTPQPVKYMDAVYGFPVELGMYGNFSYRISNISHLHSNIIGNSSAFTLEDMKEAVTSRIGQKIANIIAEKKYGFAEIDSHLNDIADTLQHILINEYEGLGLAITDFRISGTMFDAATQQRIAGVSNVAADVKAASAAGLSYVEMQQLKALRDAARNEGGLAGAGAQMGAGMELGKLFNKEKDALLNTDGDAYENLKKLKVLLDENIITQAEFEQKKTELLGKL